MHVCLWVDDFRQRELLRGWSVGQGSRVSRSGRFQLDAVSANMGMGVRVSGISARRDDARAKLSVGVGQLLTGRSAMRWLEIFEEAGLTVLKEEVQEGLPDDLFTVKT